MPTIQTQGMIRTLAEDLVKKAEILEDLLSEDVNPRKPEVMEVYQTLELLEQTLRHLSDRFHTLQPY